jgi:two-component system, NtrC family, response regulator HydG
MFDNCLSEVTMLKDRTVLIVDSDDKTRDIVFESAVKHGEIPISCSSCGEAQSLVAQQPFKVVFCSDSLPDGEYDEVIRAAKPTPVIVLSRFAEWESYLAAMQAGAFDYIACPPSEVEVDRILSSALKEHLQPLKELASAA